MYKRYELKRLFCVWILSIVIYNVWVPGQTIKSSESDISDDGRVFSPVSHDGNVVEPARHATSAKQAQTPASDKVYFRKTGSEAAPTAHVRGLPIIPEPSE